MTKKSAPPTVDVPDWIPSDAWLGFVEMRKVQADLTQQDLDQLDRLLERVYFSGIPEAAALRQPVWDLHGRLKHYGLNERKWTAPEVAA